MKMTSPKDISIFENTSYVGAICTKDGVHVCCIWRCNNCNKLFSSKQINHTTNECPHCHIALIDKFDTRRKNKRIY